MKCEGTLSLQIALASRLRPVPRVNDGRVTSAELGGNVAPFERVLEGCMNETLFDGLWRLKVLKVEAAHKDDAPLAPGCRVTVEVRNGWTGTLNPGDAGFADDNMFVVEPGGNSLALDAYNEQPFVGHVFLGCSPGSWAATTRTAPLLSRFQRIINF